jgi:hypothetical protein
MAEIKKTSPWTRMWQGMTESQAEQKAREAKERGSSPTQLEIDMQKSQAERMRLLQKGATGR